MQLHFLIFNCQAYASHGKSNSEFKLEDAAELAREVIAEARANPPSPNAQPAYDWGFLLSFWTYPIAEALAYVVYEVISLLVQGLMRAQCSWILPHADRSPIRDRGR